MALLTPVCKAFQAENGTTVTQLAVQVHGGHGYVRDSGVEQRVRDVRMAQIYDRTTAIQARDLLARKILPDGGRAMDRYITVVCVRRPAPTWHWNSPRCCMPCATGSIA